MRSSVLFVGMAIVTFAGVARTEEGFSFGKHVPRADPGLSLGLGPSLQLGAICRTSSTSAAPSAFPVAYGVSMAGRPGFI
jgi:hypothetical protein